MANSDIGFITKENFLKLLPDRVPVRKSAKPGARFPIYCHCPKLGPVPVNTRVGQGLILENAVMYGPDGPEVKTVEPVQPVVEPEQVRVDPVEEPESSGFLSSFLTLDD
jgi:hypothetical protein